MIYLKVIIFETATLKYITTIEDVPGYVNKFTTSIYSSPIVLANVSWSNPSLIKIYKFEYDNNYSIKSQCQYLIISTFKDIQCLKLSEKVFFNLSRVMLLLLSRIRAIKCIFINLLIIN
jgi:hypothetical protein